MKNRKEFNATEIAVRAIQINIHQTRLETHYISIVWVYICVSDGGKTVDTVSEYRLKSAFLLVLVSHYDKP